MSFPRYPKYKDSRVEWLGEVPEHWLTCLLKRAFKSVDYGISDSLDCEGAVAILRMGNIANGKVITDDLKYIASVDPALLLRPGDLLYNRTNSLDLIGKVGIFLGSGDSPISFASYLVRLRTMDESLSTYFAYLLNTEGILEIARANAFVAIGQCNLNPTRYGQITIAIPPKSEQRAISTFLDQKISKIDGLVAEQQRLIELLKEKRQAVISHTVTKGLNPNTAMKPSGVEWLGEVPEHWKVFPLKRDLDFLTSGSRGWADNYSDEGELFIRIANLTRDSIRIDLSETQRVVVPEGLEGRRTKVRSGDLLFSITAYLGSVAVVPEDLESAYVSQHVALARLRQSQLLPQWAGYVALSIVGQTWFGMQSYGGTKVQLSLDDVRNLPITVPPISEQHAIETYLEIETAKFDTLTDEAQRAIDLLQERRTALISAAVTGKIDVRPLFGRKAA